MAASKPMFNFEDLRKELNTLQLHTGQQKWSKIIMEMKILETAIINKNINDFDNSYKNLEKTASSKTKSMGFYTKLSELKRVVDKVRGRGDALGCISTGGEMVMTGQQFGDGKRNHGEESLLKGSGNKRPPSGKKGRPDGSGIKKPQAGGQGRSEGSENSTARSATESSSSHHQFKRTDDRNAFTREQNSQQLANQVEYCSEEIKTLYIKLKSACKELQIKDESSDKKSEEKDLKDKESSLRKGIADVNEQIDRIIRHLEITRNTTSVKEKAQEKQAQTVAEQDTKAKIATLTEWLDKLKRQVEECKYDVTVFQKLKNKDEKHDTEMKKYKTCLVDICNKLKNKSDEENSLRKDNQKRINEFEKQTELIRKIWVEDCKGQVNEPLDTNSTLKQLKQYIYDNRKAVEALKKDHEGIKAEINLLMEDISSSSDGTEFSTAKTGKTNPEILQDIRNARKQLNGRKKKVEKEMRNRSTDKKQDNTELRKHVVSLWKVAIGTDRDVTNAEGADGRIQDELQMLNIIVPELEKLEEISLDLIGVSNQIHQHVIGVPPSVKDTEKLNTTKDVLNRTLKILGSCHKETDVFAANFPKLFEAMSVESTNTNETFSGKCRLITEAAKRWKEDRQDMEIFLGKCKKLIPLAYEQLTVEPYWFEEPDINSGSIKERFPVWLQDVVFSMSQILGCIKKNKDSFRQRFTETSLVFECLFKMYTEITKEKYIGKWEESKPGQQRVEEKSSLPRLHVTSVIEDICKRISKSSADTVEQKYQKEIKRLKEEHTELEQERQSLLTRLSKLAGANLTNNNPNIADLSDPHRPTKLAEEYSELYDNEWTAAFEEFDKQGKPEKEIVKLLLGIILETYGVCGDIGRNQNSVIRSGLLSPADLIMRNVHDGSKTANKTARSSGKPKGEPMKPNEESLAAVHSKTISELRKQTAKFSVSSIIEYFKAQPQFSEWFKTKDVEVYTVRCIKLCWLMNVQDPPVYMERDLKAGTSFETAKYKPYTKAGKKIAFVVWPALFLHDGGAILAKGVAQGK